MALHLYSEAHLWLRRSAADCRHVLSTTDRPRFYTAPSYATPAYCATMQLAVVLFNIIEVFVGKNASSFYLLVPESIFRRILK